MKKCCIVVTLNGDLVVESIWINKTTQQRQRICSIRADYGNFHSIYRRKTRTSVLIPFFFFFFSLNSTCNLSSFFFPLFFFFYFTSSPLSPISGPSVIMSNPPAVQQGLFVATPTRIDLLQSPGVDPQIPDIEEAHHDLLLPPSVLELQSQQQQQHTPGSADFGDSTSSNPTTASLNSQPITPLGTLHEYPSSHTAISSQTPSTIDDHDDEIHIVAEQPPQLHDPLGFEYYDLDQLPSSRASLADEPLSPTTDPTGGLRRRGSKIVNRLRELTKSREELTFPSQGTPTVTSSPGVLKKLGSSIKRRVSNPILETKPAK